MRLRNIWWLLLLRGIVFLIFGVFAISWPLITFVTLGFVFAFYLIFSGIFNLILGIIGIHHTHRYWFLTLMIAILEIAVGAYALNNPLLNIELLTLLIGFTLIVRGIFETIAAFDDIYASSHRTLLAIGGVLGIIAGAIVLRYPIAGGIAFTWVLGFYALIAGAILVALSMVAKDITDDIVKTVSPRSQRVTAKK